jgi:hypothetical protein
MRIVPLLAVFVSAGAFAPLLADPADNNATYDPDATPRAYAEKPKTVVHQSADQIAAQRTEAQEKDNWLVRSYEEQLQARSLADGQSQSNNLYSEIASNPDLAKAAGIAPAAAPPAPAVTDLRTGSNASLTLRSGLPAPATTKTASTKTAGSTFNPVLAPIDSGEAAALHDLFSSMPAFSANNTSSLHDDPSAADPGALDTPGMTAAENDPTNRGKLDLALDPLPAETSDVEKPRHQLALAMPGMNRDADQAHQAQSTETLAPGQRKTTSPAPINPVLLRDPESATANMVPDPPPIRGQVGDPYDILR